MGHTGQNAVYKVTFDINNSNNDNNHQVGPVVDNRVSHARG